MKLESVTVLFLVSLVIVNSQVVFEDEEEQRKPPSRSFDKNKNDNILVTITLGQPSSQSQSGFRRPSQQQSFQQRPNEFGFGNNNGFQQTRPFQHNSNGNFPNQQGSFQSNQGFRRPSGPPANNFQNQQGSGQFGRPTNSNNFQNQQGSGQFGRPTSSNNFQNQQQSGFGNSNQVVVESRSPDCRTYQDDGGYCTPLSDCGRIASLLQDRSPIFAARVLSRSLCGFSGIVPNVCCPTARNQQQPPPRPPVSSSGSSFPPGGNGNNAFDKHRENNNQPPGTNGPGIIIIPPSSTTTTTSTTTTPFPIQPIPESTKKPFIGSQGGSLIIGNGPVALVSPVQANWSTPVNFSEEGLPAECGVSKVGNTRIVGGLPAKKGAWPWIAALGYREHTGNVNYLCGGALVSSIYVVTASHCLYGRNDLVSVRLGDHDLYSEGDGAKPIEAGVEKIILHPNYDPATFKNDIALIKLKRPVQFSDEIRPICLPSTPKLRNERFENAAPFVAGWGAIQFNGPTSSELRQVQVHTVPDNDCQQKYSSFKTAVVDDTNVCAGVQGGGKDACQGDSGGPLQQPVGTRNKYVLIGVVSFGFKCAEPGFPGVYTRVTAHIDWLQKTMEP